MEDSAKIQRMDVSRRNALKTISGVGAAFALGSGVVTAQNGSEVGTPISPNEHELPYPNTEVYRVDDSIKAITPHYELLTLNPGSVRSYIKAAGLRESDREAVLDFLVEMRRKYPVIKEHDGNNVTFTLAEGATSTGRVDANVSKPKDSEVTFADAAEAFNKGAKKVATDSDDISAQFAKSGHQRQVRRACNQLNIDSSETDDIVSHADDPDEYGCNCEADKHLNLPKYTAEEIKQAFQTALDFVTRYYSQYHDPDVTVSYLGVSYDLGSVGTAPEAGQKMMDGARNTSGLARRGNLGYATHYVADMAIPLHTGMGLEQAGVTFNNPTEISTPKKWLHYGYEEFVHAKWSDGLKSEFEGNNVPYYPINSTKQAIKDMADFSSDYSYDIYHRILDEGVRDYDKWSSDTRSKLKEKAANCMSKNGLYTRGFLKEFY